MGGGVLQGTCAPGGDSPGCAQRRPVCREPGSRVLCPRVWAPFPDTRWAPCTHLSACDARGCPVTLPPSEPSRRAGWLGAGCPGGLASCSAGQQVLPRPPAACPPGGNSITKERDSALSWSQCAAAASGVLEPTPPGTRVTGWEGGGGWLPGSVRPGPCQAVLPPGLAAPRGRTRVTEGPGFPPELFLPPAGEGLLLPSGRGGYGQGHHVALWNCRRHGAGKPCRTWLGHSGCQGQAPLCPLWGFTEEQPGVTGAQECPPSLPPCPLP